jgi:uncharacterized LabA/DUF88 family protein
MATAIMVDGAFFLRRFQHSFPNLDSNDPTQVALGLGWLVHWHLSQRHGSQKLDEIMRQGRLMAETPEFYRLFFYDCKPLTKRMHTPVERKCVDFSKTKEAIFRIALHSDLQKRRKVALRLGRLNDSARWKLTPQATDRLIKNPTEFSPADDDFRIDTIQKGVDMRLGLDVASLAYKRQADQIILVAADADFVPAVKLARREGIDVVLDRMGATTAATDLLEHVDGVRDCRLLIKLPEKQ